LTYFSLKDHQEEKRRVLSIPNYYVSITTHILHYYNPIDYN